jgi:hypothetical protein
LSDRPVIKLDGSNVSLDNLYISAGNSTVRWYIQASDR